MKKTAIVMLIVFLFTLFPLNVLAKDLPDPKLPEMEPLEDPELSKDFNELIKELEKQGFGKFENEPGKKISLPNAATPKGTGKDATDKFKEDYGDMKNDPNRQLNKNGIIPDDKHFESVYDFGEANKENFDNIREANRDRMANLMKKELDKSFLWDLESIKKDFSKKFLSDGQISTFLNATPKQAGWDEVKRRSFIVPKMPELKMRDLEDMVFIPFIKGNHSTTSPKKQAKPQKQSQRATSTVTQKATPPAAKSPAKVLGMMPSPVVGPVPEKEEGLYPAPKPGFNPSPVAVPSPAMAKKETFWDKTKNVMNTVGSTVKKGASWVGEKAVAVGNAIVEDVKADPMKYVGLAVVAAACFATGGAAAAFAAGGGGALALIGG